MIPEIIQNVVLCHTIQLYLSIALSSMVLSYTTSYLKKVKQIESIKKFKQMLYSYLIEKCFYSVAEYVDLNI